MSSGRDPPLFAGRTQQPRKGSGYLTSTPESAFRQPAPPPDTSEQQFSQRSRHTTEPKGRISSQYHVSPSQVIRRPPTHTGHTRVPVPAKLSNIMTTKSSQSLTPLWQELDDTFQERLRVKRRREESGKYTARRITGRQSSAAKSKDDTIDVEHPDRPKANIRPELRLNQIDQPDKSDDSDHDEPRYRPQAKYRSRKSLAVARCVVFFYYLKKLLFYATITIFLF